MGSVTGTRISTIRRLPLDSLSDALDASGGFVPLTHENLGRCFQVVPFGFEGCGADLL